MSLYGELHELVREEIESGVEPMPGALALAQAARQSGLRLGIASNGQTDLVAPTLLSIGATDLFDAIVTADDGASPKPAPDVYLEACRQLGTTPAHAVALEDSPTGFGAAIAASLRVIAVPSPAKGATAIPPKLAAQPPASKHLSGNPVASGAVACRSSDHARSDLGTIAFAPWGLGAALANRQGSAPAGSGHHHAPSVADPSPNDTKLQGSGPRASTGAPARAVTTRDDRTVAMDHHAAVGMRTSSVNTGTTQTRRLDQPLPSAAAHHFPVDAGDAPCGAES